MAELNEWTVAQLADIDDPGALEFFTGEKDEPGAWPFRGFVVRWRGEVYAYANVCPHAGHPLNLDPGEFFTPDRTHLLCRSHGAVFDVATGACTGGPCRGESLQRLECYVAGNDIRVLAPASMRDL